MQLQKRKGLRSFSAPLSEDSVKEGVREGNSSLEMPAFEKFLLMNSSVFMGRNSHSNRNISIWKI